MTFSARCILLPHYSQQAPNFPGNFPGKFRSHHFNALLQPNYTTKSLRHIPRCDEVFEIEEIVYALSRQLSWTRLHNLICIDAPSSEISIQKCAVAKAGVNKKAT